MKKLFLSLLILAFMAGNVQAITSHSYSINVGYSQASFVFDTVDPDSAVRKIVVFYGATQTTVIRKDSLTSSITDPDTVAKAVGTFEEGTTYYWYVTIEDSTTTVTEPSDGSFYSFTTTDLTQSTSVLYAGYSTVGIGIDSVVAAGLSLDSVRLDIDKTDGTTYSASITTVTVPQDTFAVTSLDEGATYYCRTIAFLTDSSAADTLAVISFTTTDLTVSIAVTSLAGDSIGVIVDTSGIIVDSLIFQTGAGLVTAVAETLTTVTGVDTFYVVDMMLGGVYSYRVLAFLPDSSAIETTTTYTYTMPDPWAYRNIGKSQFKGNVLQYKLSFDQSSDEPTTGLIDITPYRSIKIYGILLGEDDAATYDSASLVLYSINQVGTKALIDSLIKIDIDTATVTGETQQYVLRLPTYAVVDTAAIAADDWYSFIEIVVPVTDSAGSAFADSAIGLRSVYLTVEFQE